ncbi:hypothetical protein [Mycobacterium botniense]|uniref:Uncharacterized protein n=1 Tax=Mycobacterium botniense TaxID=84962 RepID=A0A7I9Y050_9MYCO|nr:hypothetical protein [Mycobacterium botniense]GFG75438.1 hypothetical protein MBOT_28030 [Mycobacterium botniense]
MAWFLALQGPGHLPHQSLVYELQDSADVDKISQELVSSATLDRVVPIPVVLPRGNRRHQKVTLYVRPAAWGVWAFYQLSEEERRQLVKENPVLNALSQAAQQRAQAKPTVQLHPLTGQAGSDNVGSSPTRP